MPDNDPPSSQPAKTSPEQQPSNTSPTQLPDEYDRRGIKLPARTLVGGIITPA